MKTSPAVKTTGATRAAVSVKSPAPARDEYVEVELPEEMLKLVRKAARQLGITPAAYVHQALQERLERLGVVQPCTGTGGAR